MSILAVGTVAFDSVETSGGEVRNGIGGSATYFSAAASFYGPVALIAVVGQDFPVNSLKFLKDRNVDLSGLEVKDGKTFSWSGKYEENMNNRHTIETNLNVLLDFQPKLKEEHCKLDHLFLANLDPDIQNSVLDQSTGSGIVGSDTMDFWIEGNRESLLLMLKQIDLLIINDSEARQLVEEVNLVRAAKKILNLGPQTVVIKKGEHGASLFTADTYFSVPAYPVVDVIDPTGAGDSFAGGFIGYLSECNQKSVEAMKKAMIHGSIMASFNVEDFSTRRLESLTREEISKRHDKFLAMITP